MTDSVDPAAPTGEAEVEICPHCLKEKALCICDEIVPIDNRVALLVLQHPQEQDKTLGTARVAVRNLKNATFKIGLSWASLAKALGRAADPKRWAVLYLGSAGAEDFPPGRDLVVLDRQGRPAANQDSALAGIEGVVVLDGTWSQAKTLWWRNPWVLKARRIAIRPQQPSLYGKLRREPRREGLSTIEAAAFVLSRLERRPEIETRMKQTFARMLARYRAAQAEKAGPRT